MRDEGAGFHYAEESRAEINELIEPQGVCFGDKDHKHCKRSFIREFLLIKAVWILFFLSSSFLNGVFLISWR